jgi:hypothetical protein
MFAGSRLARPGDKQGTKPHLLAAASPEESREVAMSDLPLPGLTPGDPENRLSHDARQRIGAALVESDRIRKQALSGLEIRYRAEASGDVRFMEYLATGNAFIDFTESRMKAARVVLRVEAEEYGKLGMPDHDFREIMRTKIEEFVYSLEFSALQRDALEAEFLWSTERERPASVVPTDVSPPEETPSSIKLTAGQRVRAFIEEHDLDVPQFAGMIHRSVRQVGYVLADTPVGKKTQAAVAKVLGTTPEELFPE